MPYVVTLQDYRPSPRYDSLPWTQARIEEGTASTGTFVALETQNLTPVDSDPSNPAWRNFTTQLGTAPDLWYRVVFLDATGDLGLPTFPVQNSSTGRPVYATTSELARLLRVDENQRHASLRRCLEMAATEIDSEIGPTDINGTSLPYGSPPALVAGVSIDRAVEHWAQTQAPWGIVGLGSETGPMYTSKDSWDRHAQKLRPLKGEFAIA